MHPLHGKAVMTRSCYGVVPVAIATTKAATSVLKSLEVTSYWKARLVCRRVPSGRMGLSCHRHGGVCVKVWRPAHCRQRLFGVAQRQARFVLGMGRRFEVRVRTGLGESCAQVLGDRLAGHSRFARRLVAWSVPKKHSVFALARGALVQKQSCCAERILRLWS